MKRKYDPSSIVEMSQLDHLRQNSGMYVGGSEDATRLVEELLDNSLDEVQQGCCDIVGLYIDTKHKIYKVLDNGRGFPFDQSLPLEDDPPIKASTKLFTSGKFKKGSEDSAYGIAVGLHGIGLVACYALSDYMNIEIYRNNKHATYKFEHSGKIERMQEECSKDKKAPFSTKIELKPCKKYFSSTEVDIKRLEERLKIAVANYPTLKVVFSIDDEKKVISGNEEDFIENMLGINRLNWISFDNTKGEESYKLKLCWDDNPPITPKTLSTVNLCRVDNGTHVNYINNTLKTYFQEKANKYKYNFQPNDYTVGLRLYLNLKIVHASFSEQIKDRLASNSTIDILDEFPKQLDKYFKNNEDDLKSILEKFQTYRHNLSSKKMLNNSVANKKRGLTVLTKLSDCTDNHGSLFICEGQSASANFLEVRDARYHAILPLRGIPQNCLKHTDFYKNAEFKEILIACGVQWGDNLQLDDLRYDEIIITADADPAGSQIVSLLITFFAAKLNQIIKSGRLKICHTPLYGYHHNNKFVPIWSEDELEEKRQNHHIEYFKGLGSYDPKDFAVFTLDKKMRKLTTVQWSEKYEKLFLLMQNSGEKRKLFLNTWSIDDIGNEKDEDDDEYTEED